MLQLATELFPAVRLVDGLGWVDPASGKIGRPPNGPNFEQATGRVPSALTFHVVTLPEGVPVVSGGGLRPMSSPTFDALRRAGYGNATWLIMDRPGAAVAELPAASQSDSGKFRGAAAVAALKALGGWDETNPMAVMTGVGSYVVYLSLSDDPGWRLRVVKADLPWRALVEQLSEHDSPDSSMTVALDWDKAIVFNDAYGHVEGDLVLARALQIVAAHAARADVSFARVAGDEFIAVFAGDAQETASRWANDVVSEVRRMAIPFHHPEVSTNGVVTVTACVATAGRTTLSSLAERCQELFHVGKQRGGSTIVSERE